MTGLQIFAYLCTWKTVTAKYEHSKTLIIGIVYDGESSHANSRGFR